MILFYTKLKKKLRIVFRKSYRKFRCECSIYNSTMAIWNRFVTSADFWLVVWILKMHSWLEIKCQTECNNDYDKNKGHAYRFLCDLTFSFRTSNWNNHVYTILHIFEHENGQSSEEDKQSEIDPSIPTLMTYHHLFLRHMLHYQECNYFLCPYLESG